MSKKLFNVEEIKILKSNIYVKKVSNKGITYTDEFKKIFIEENLLGSLPRNIFESYGLSVEILGIKRIESSGKRWRKQYRNVGIDGLQDTRKKNNGRPTIKNLSLEEKYKKLEEKIAFLEAENQFLKKLDQLERGLIKL